MMKHKGTFVIQVDQVYPLLADGSVDRPENDDGTVALQINREIEQLRTDHPECAFEILDVSRCLHTTDNVLIDAAFALVEEREYESDEEKQKYELRKC